MKKYVLTTFCILEMPAEIFKLSEFVNKFADYGSVGASSGPITLTFFDSNLSLLELKDKLDKFEFKYILSETENSIIKLPSEMGSMVGQTIEQNERRSAVQKVPLEEQLESALAKQDYMLAAKIRDKINSKYSNK